MRECLYKEITSIIDRHSTWIDVGKTCRYVCLVVVSYNRIRVVPCRTLPLRAYHNKWHYNYGHLWFIPFPELDRAVAEMKKSNRLFKQRLLLNKLTIDDVEEIVYRATYGIIKLELSDIEY